MTTTPEPTAIPDNLAALAALAAALTANRASGCGPATDGEIYALDAEADGLIAQIAAVPATGVADLKLKAAAALPFLDLCDGVLTPDEMALLQSVFAAVAALPQTGDRSYAASEWRLDRAPVAVGGVGEGRKPPAD